MAAVFGTYEPRFPGDPLALPDPSFHVACQPPPDLILGITAVGNINDTPVVALVTTACPFVVINSTLANHLNLQVDPLPADTDVEDDGEYVVGIVGQTRDAHASAIRNSRGCPATRAGLGNKRPAACVGVRLFLNGPEGFLGQADGVCRREWEKRPCACLGEK